MLRKLGFAGITALVASLLVAGIALALQITVDGAINDWTFSGDPLAAQVATDADEQGPPVTSDIPNRWDVSTLYFTNDSANVYFRWDTYANTTYLGTFQLLCIDIDPNASPATGGTIAQCSNQTGIDYIFYRVAGTNNLLQCDNTAIQWQDCADVTGTSVLAFGFSGTHTEVSIRLADIGYTTLPLGTGNCPNSSTGQPCPMHIALYFDNGGTPPDDNVPDAGDLTVQVGCAAGGTPCSPTAITLNSLQAQPTTSPVVLVALVGVSALALIGVVFVARRRKTA
jgi:hypothetical protein